MSAPSPNNQIRNIVIVGGGTAGWITAAAFGRVLSPKDYAVTLVESDQIGTVGVGEATIPPIRDFHRMLGINEAEFVAQTQATFKLGIEFIDWQRTGTRYFHPFGEYGRKLDAIAFHQYWLRAQALQDCGDLADYSLCTVAAYAGKFAPPDNDPGSVLSSMSHAYHFDAALYAAYLRRYAENLGVVRVEGKLVDVELDGGTGFIKRIKLESSASIDGDFFVDCTGFTGLLIGEALGIDYQDWSHYLPADSALALQTSGNGGPTLPYTQSTAHPAGWRWRIPLQHRVGNGIVFSSQFMSDDEASGLLLSSADGEALTEPRRIGFLPGKRRVSWEKNCVAIGLSSGFLEPLESTSIHLIQTAVTRLLQLFPGREFSPALAAEFNAQVTTELEFIRDFIILHYHLNERDEPMWEYCRHMPVPDSLQDKLRLFRDRGRVLESQHDLFKVASWVAVMRGQGLDPEFYDPLVNRRPTEQLLPLLDELRRAYRAARDAMPTHDEFLQQITEHQQ